MIDITVDDRERIVEIDMTTHFYSSQNDMVVLLCQLINKVKYSGESISLFRAEKDKKVLVEEW